MLTGSLAFRAWPFVPLAEEKSELMKHFNLPNVLARAPMWLFALVAFVVIVAAQTAWLSQGRAGQSLDIAGRETVLTLSGMHDLEQDARSRYRWTTGESSVYFAPTSPGGHSVLQLMLGPRPAEAGDTLTVRVGERDLLIPVDVGARRYNLLLPSGVGSTGLELHLRSQPFQIAGDARELGLRFEGASLTQLGQLVRLPSWVQLLAQLAILLLGAWLLRRLKIAKWLAQIILLLASTGLLAMSLWQPFLMASYSLRLALAMLLLVLLTLLLLPALQRWCKWMGMPEFVGWVWGVALLACLLRFAATLYPLFYGFDIGLNTDRIIFALSGRMIILRPSIEFHNGLTIYPPGPYLSAMPALLLGLEPWMVVQASMSLVDGLSTFAIAMLARALGVNRRGTLIAALLYAAVRVGLTGLWFGLTQQVFAQTLMAPIALLLLTALRKPQYWRYWILLGILLGMVAFSHIGVMLISFIWMGFAWLLLLGYCLWKKRNLGDRLDQMRLVRLAATAVIAGLLAIVVLYADVVAMKIQQMSVISADLAADAYKPNYNLIWRGFSNAFHPILIWLLPIGVVILARRVPFYTSLVVLGALATALLFLLIEINTGLQVRYIYFLIPVACIMGALVLDRIIERFSWATPLVWLVVLGIMVHNVSYWWHAAWTDTMMSMVSLLR
jgi:hypothetical protein